METTLTMPESLDIDDNAPVSELSDEEVFGLGDQPDGESETPGKPTVTVDPETAAGNHLAKIRSAREAERATRLEWDSLKEETKEAKKAWEVAALFVMRVIDKGREELPLLDGLPDCEDRSGKSATIDESLSDDNRCRTGEPKTIVLIKRIAYSTREGEVMIEIGHEFNVRDVEKNGRIRIMPAVDGMRDVEIYLEEDEYEVQSWYEREDYENDSWKTRPIDELADHGAGAGKINKLKLNDITTIEHFEKLRAGPGIRSIAGFGKAAVTKLENAVIEWLAANSNVKRTVNGINQDGQAYDS